MGRHTISSGPLSAAGIDIHDFFGQIREIQHRLGTLVGHVDAPDPARKDCTPTTSTEFVRGVLKLRAARRGIFGNALFGEPAWEVLLELYEAQLTHRSESVSSLCIASGVPATTALRWIQNLENDGWIERTADPKDRRRVFVKLSQKGQDAMNRLFARSELAKRISETTA